MGLPSVWSRYLLIAMLVLLPMMLLSPAVVRLYYRLFGKTPPKQKPAFSLFYRGISILLAYTMLISPTLITQTADAATQYADISTLAWGKVGNTITYEYDANGSLTSKVTTGVDAEEVVYIYNLQNRLSQVVRTTPADLDTDEQEDDAIVETTWYYYNDEGIRVGTEYKREEVTDIGEGGESRSTTDDTVTSFLIDSYNHTGYAQVFEELSDDGSDITATTYTFGDDVISQVKSTWNGSSWTAGGTRYLLSDGQGSTRQLVDSSAAVVDSFSYDGYGMMLGGNPTSAAPAATNLLYTGEQWDASAQQYYLRARYYDPSNGRFNRMDDYPGNTQDPQSLHKYLYCHANPVNGIDPSGEFSIVTTIAVISIVAVIFTISQSISQNHRTTSNMKIIHPAPSHIDLFYNAYKWGVTFDRSKQLMILTDSYLFAAMQEAYVRHFHSHDRSAVFNTLPYFLTSKDFLEVIMADADTVFHDFARKYPGWKYKYKGEPETYSGCDVNYIGVGLGFNHFKIPFRHYWIDDWNERGPKKLQKQYPNGAYGGYGHPGTDEEKRWADYGYNHYNEVVNSLVK